MEFINCTKKRKYMELQHFGDFDRISDRSERGSRNSGEQTLIITNCLEYETVFRF